MELRFAQKKDDIAGLWREVFPDDWGNVYFSRDFASAGTLVYEDIGQIVSMLHWTNQTMKIWDEDIPCAYILGIGTKPEYRGRGLAGDLIEQALFELHLRGMPLACLIPAGQGLADFYSKYGFSQVGRLMRAPGQIERYPEAGSADIPGLNAMYEGLVQGFPYITRPNERWEAILDEYDVEFSKNTGYAVFDRNEWIEGTGGFFTYSGPNSACLKVVEAKAVAALAKKHDKPLPGGIHDTYCPWNGLDGIEGCAVAEELWFSETPPYINLLHNGKDGS